MSNRTSVLTILPIVCLVLLAASFAGSRAQARESTVQPEAAGPQPGRPGPAQQLISPSPDETRDGLPYYFAWLPPNKKYTAIILTSNAKERRWIVSIRTKTGNFPVTIGPGETVTIPFIEGWSVTSNDEARIESQYIPFDDPTQRNLLGSENLSVSAWGVTPSGPVNFFPSRRSKP